MLRQTIHFLILVALSCSCSVKRYLPAGERIYRGADIKVEKQGNVKATSHYLRKQLKLAAKPVANKFAFGQPYKVWWWYVLGEPRNPNGVRAYFRNKLGEPPILSSKVNAPVTASNMQAFLENLGYFHSQVKGDTVNKGYMTSAVYTAAIKPQYKIKNIDWAGDTSALVKLLQQKQQSGILRTGNGYRLSDIQAERDRLDLYIKTQGYYYFNPNYIMAYADTAIGNHEVNLLLSLRKQIPQKALHVFKINQVMVFPNYTLLLPPPDTSKNNTSNYDGLLLRDTVYKFKPRLFKEEITYRPGSIYSSTNQNTTLNRLINLGTFKFVKNRYEQVKDSSGPYNLNVFYYLTPARKKSLAAEIDGFSKENKFLGSQLSLNWRNRNTFNGAELLLIKVYTGLELSFADSLKKTTNYRTGVEASLNFPRFYVPFIKIKEHNLYPPHTRFLAGYEYFRKQLFYSKNIYRLQYQFSWKETSNTEQTLSPLVLTYIKSGKLTDTFAKAILRNPAYSANIFNELILGSVYTFTFNTANPFATRQWYFKGSLDAAGNIAGLVNGAKQPRQKTIFNTPFAQYVKVDFDMRYQKRLPNNFDWINRILIGIGLPYGNSNILPFSKQYVIGGSSSLRGFQMRQIGPGSYKPTLNDQRYFTVIGGDYKLQLNSELRVPLVAKLTGAMFLDIGNIWTKDTLLFGKAGQLKKDFYKELAVAAGLGLRFDAGLVLLRVDMGIPIRKPYLPEGQQWIINKTGWGERNVVFNIALGYPF